MIHFDPGKVVMTPGAFASIRESGQKPSQFILRHIKLEQGELSDSDHRANLAAMKTGFRIFSSFRTVNGENLWIITEAIDLDAGVSPKRRELTISLLPEEY